MSERVTSLQARSAWCVRHYGAKVQVHRRALDDAQLAFGVMEFRCEGLPYHDAPHHVYVTNGMSDRRMPWREGPTIPPRLQRYRIELLALTHRRADWVIDLLTGAAQYPFVHQTGFAFGHTIPVADGVSTCWPGFVLGFPPNHEELNPLGIVADGLDGDPVLWLHVIGLKEDELNAGVDRGGQELLESLSNAPGHEELAFLDSKRGSLLGHA